MKSCQIESASPEATIELARQIGQRCRGGEVIELVSDLGGGKTTLVRGLAQGLGSSDQVASPTFTLSRIYQAGQLQLHHFDFYRLPAAELMAHELAEVLAEASNIVVIEWGRVVESVLPSDRLRIEITPTGDKQRRLNFNFPEQLDYLVEALC